MTSLHYLGEFPILCELDEYVDSKGLRDTPRFCWTTFARPDGGTCKAIALWIPAGGYDRLWYQICPVEHGGSDAGKWAWSWDGNVRQPTLAESIRSTIDDPVTRFEGHILEGCWVPR